MELKEIGRHADSLVRQKGWYEEQSTKPQYPKNLAISIVLESSELLECFQWNDSADRDKVAEELADIILYASQVANVMGIDLDAAIAEKIKYNQRREWDPE